MQLTTERLIRLRDDARLERDTMMERRVRDGEDPAQAFDEMPSVDEFVVLTLRDELLEERGQLAEFGLARLAARSSGPDARLHRQNADRVEFGLLREIAAAVPQLTIAVWQCAAHIELTEGAR